MFFVGYDVRTKEGDPLLTPGDDVDLVPLLMRGDDVVTFQDGANIHVCTPGFGKHPVHES